ncbi:hypothetical protein AVEN_88750-1, partial [Araneus ventricosus]
MACGFPVKSGRYDSSDTEVRALIDITGHNSTPEGHTPSHRSG